VTKICAVRLLEILLEPAGTRKMNHEEFLARADEDILAERVDVELKEAYLDGPGDLVNEGISYLPGWMI